MSKSIFISCVHEDKHLFDTLEKWAADGKFGDVKFIHAMEDDIRVDGNDAIHRYILEKLEPVAAVAVLIGTDTHNHKWISWEVEIAKRRSKKVFCIRIPDTTGAKPSILKEYEEVPFDLHKLKNAIGKL